PIFSYLSSFPGAFKKRNTLDSLLSMLIIGIVSRYCRDHPYRIIFREGKNEMALNPFKDSTYRDLQIALSDFFEEKFGGIRADLASWWKRFKKKGNERITIMFIPHSEKKIVNFHVSIFAISAVGGTIAIITLITSILIFNHTSTVKEVSRLKLYGSDSKVQIQYYKEEIDKLYDLFQHFKPEITYLYSLDSDNGVDALWAKGGGSAPASEKSESDPDAPALEILNLDEMERELHTSKDVLEKVKIFMEQRKKIIENTPSLWPVNGYIVSGYGRHLSSFSAKEETGNGLEIAAYPGAEIHATAPGEVESIRWDPIKGLTITVRHKYGFMTVYSHCQRVSVEKDQKVSKGETIAYVGRTGRASQHLCEYQIIIGNSFVDPLPYLNKIVRDIR
ncbi:MAG TPA: M23 family metallopeptidase, partial [Spirochaetota bacterium]